MPETDATADVAALTVQLLSAYLANNTLASEDLAALIKSTKAALTQEAEAIAAPSEHEAITPAVSVRKSLASPEHIISLIDGKPYKALKRHLTSRGLTPDEYRSRYGLPASYPMVAPAYAAHRRDVAQKIGLGGRKSAAAAGDSEAAPLVDEALERELPEVSSTSGSEEGQPESTPPSGKAPARKAKSKVPGGDTPASSAQPSEPAVAPDIVPDEGTGAGSEGSPKPKPKSTGASQQKKESPAKPSPKPTRKTKAGSATKADAALGAVLPAPELASTDPEGGTIAEDGGDVRKRRGKIGLFPKKSSDAAEPSSEPARSNRPKRVARTPKPEDGGVGE
jgi:predicted transcriptional regulator